MQYLSKISAGLTAYFFASEFRISSAGPPAPFVTGVSGPYAAVAMPCSMSDEHDRISRYTGACLLLVILQEVNVLQVGMELDLVDGRRNRRSLQNPVELLWEIVAHTNGFCEALVLEFFHLLPLALVVFFLVAEERGMDEIPVGVVRLGIQNLQTRHIQVDIV